MVVILPMKFIIYPRLKSFEYMLTKGLIFSTYFELSRLIKHLPLPRCPCPAVALHLPCCCPHPRGMYGSYSFTFLHPLILSILLCSGAVFFPRLLLSLVSNFVSLLSVLQCPMSPLILSVLLSLGAVLLLFWELLALCTVGLFFWVVLICGNLIV